MDTAYRLVGAQNPADRIDQVLVESASEDYPDGKVLALDGPALPLSDDQYAKLSRFVRLEPVKPDRTPDLQIVDQPGVEVESLSTDEPPDPGTTPDIDGLSKGELVAELDRVRATDPTALPDMSERSNMDDLKRALNDYHGQGA